MTTDVFTHHDTVHHWAARALAAWRRRRRVAATVQALQALDDRTLNDIGVPRHSIRDVATDVLDKRHRH